MDTSTDQTGCAARSWRVAVYGGIAVAVLFMAIGGAGLFQAIIAGAVSGGVLGFVLTRYLCSETAEEPATQMSPPQPDPAPAPTAPEMSDQQVAEVAEPEMISSLVKPSKDLPGQQELSNRKGTWKYKGPNATA
ncbi:hypothetical protein [Phaeobacter sp. NW0010-22]|uniref:hypothetical protein n=1 Tax=Phaeobacter sp. NW0010-22 TaxID=3135907 RepID=UPI0031068B33